jgi:hypothetical protein
MLEIAGGILVAYGVVRVIGWYYHHHLRPWLDSY